MSNDRGYPCEGCSEVFETFKEAMDHSLETGHEIGSYQGGGIQ